MNIRAENHYETLGISPDTDDEAVKQAFRDLAKTYHPDYNPGNDEAERQFKEINVAYEGLKDEARRQAYNEWLAFAVKRKNFKRVQWGRLAALATVLLLGPSAILFWLALPRDIAVVQVPAELPSPLVARTEPAAKPRPAAPRDETARREAQPAAPVQESTQIKPSPPAVAEQADRQKQAGETKEPARPTTTKRYEVFLKEKPANPPPAQAPAPAPGEVTNALPKEPPSARTAADAPAAAEPERADATARAAARMLAELKEPEGGTAPQVQAATPPPVAAPKPLASRPDGGSVEPFVDCASCPVMSLTRRTATAQRGGELAVSASEVTVRQWNACVADRFCPPYRSTDGDPSAPVVGVPERAANQYARWLSETTGYPYTIVMPLGGAQRPTAASECVDRGQRQTNGGWDWLDEQPYRDDCPPSARNRPREKQQGFRVARRVWNNG